MSTTVTLTSDQMHRLVAVSAFTLKNDVSDALGCIRLTIEEGKFSAVATNLHALAQYDGDHDGEGESLPPTCIPADLLQEGLKIAKTSDCIRMEVSDDGAIHLSGRDGEASGKVPFHNFPPVERLMPEKLLDIPEGSRTYATHLALLTKLTRPAKRVIDREVLFSFSYSDTNNFVATGDGYTVVIAPIRHAK